MKKDLVWCLFYGHLPKVLYTNLLWRVCIVDVCLLFLGIDYETLFTNSSGSKPNLEHILRTRSVQNT